MLDKVNSGMDLQEIEVNIDIHYSYRIIIEFL